MSLLQRLRAYRMAEAPWDSDELIRAELFSIERLEERAMALAASFTIDPNPRRRARNIFPRFDDNARVLAEVAVNSNVAMRAFLKAHAAPGSSAAAVEPNASAERLAHLLQEHLVGAPEDEARLDNAMKQVSHALTSKIVKAALPSGLRKPFPVDQKQRKPRSAFRDPAIRGATVRCPSPPRYRKPLAARMSSDTALK